MDPHWEKIMSATVLWLLHSKYWEYSKMLYDMWKVKKYICSKKINRSRSASDTDLEVTKQIFYSCCKCAKGNEAVRKMDEKMNNINRKVEILKKIIKWIS